MAVQQTGNVLICDRTGSPVVTQIKTSGEPKTLEIKSAPDAWCCYRKFLIQRKIVPLRQAARFAGALHPSARAMLDYYAPLMDWLVEQNAGREHTLPERPV